MKYSFAAWMIIKWNGCSGTSLSAFSCEMVETKMEKYSRGQPLELFHIADPNLWGLWLWNCCT